MLGFLTLIGSQAYAAPDISPGKTDVQLTPEQKQEIAALEKEILSQKKAVISKYVKYGVMSEEKGKKITSRLEQRYQMLEQNGFVPKWEGSRHKHCQ